MIELKLLFGFMVVLHVLTAAHLCYGGRNRSPLSIEKVEVMKHLNRLNIPPVKSIKSPDGDIIDCVHISNQPAFDHPLLKNHTIKTKPSYHPNWVKDDNINMNASKVGQITSSSKETINQLWHSNGKCPKGTIPIVRINYGKKKRSLPVDHPNFIDPTLTSVGKNHEYAYASIEGHFYGSKATFNLWNPRVQEPNEFSLGQLWITGGPRSNLNSIEAGWHVDPEIHNGDTNTRLFIYWTSDGYQKAGCYNLGCAGFIQTNNKIAIGASLSPTSQVDGSQYEITIFIWKDPKEGDWWMKLGDSVVGYWPASLFTYLHESASTLEWGGEVINLNSNGHHTSTQMGSGSFAEEGFGKASYIKNIQTVDESNTLKPPHNLITQAPQKSCYNIVMGTNDNKNWGSYFYYGGPGRNENCL